MSSNPITPYSQVTGEPSSPAWDFRELLSNILGMDVVAELERFKGEVGAVEFDDEPSRTRILNQLIAVVRVALSSENTYVKQLEAVHWYPMIFSGDRNIHLEMKIWEGAKAKTIALVDSIIYHHSLDAPRTKRWRRFSGHEIGTRYVMTPQITPPFWSAD